MRKTIAVMLLLVGMLAPLGAPAPAQAHDMEGCGPRHRKFADNWPHDTAYRNLNGLGTRYEIRLVATAIFWECPGWGENGARKPVALEACYTHTDEGRRAANFNGVLFDGFFYNDVRRIEVPSIRVPNDGTVQNCVEIGFGGDSKWLGIPGYPRWKVTSWILLSDEQNQERVFIKDSSGLDHSSLYPQVALSDWHG